MNALLRRTLLATFLILGIATLAMAQNDPYAAHWKRVDSLVKKGGLPKSALAELQKIYTKAKADGAQAQVIKVLIYRMSLQQNLRENAETAATNELLAEVKDLPEPAASIGHSLLAQTYWNHYQKIRWQLYNRSATVNFTKEDPATWSAADFHREISAHYRRSMEKESMLQSTALSLYEPIIVKGNVRYLRPTLYDLLAHEALSFFNNGDVDVPKPKAAFELTDEKVFDPAAAFAAHSFATADTLSSIWQALRIYQTLLRFHSSSGNRAALVDADVHRLEWAHAHAAMSDKDEPYRKALAALYEENKGIPEAAQVGFLLAAKWNESAETWQPLGDSAHHYDRKKALELTNEIIRLHEKSEGGANAYNLRQRILQPALSFKVERVNVPAQPFRTLVSYTNLTSVDMRILTATPEIKKGWIEDRTEESGFWKRLEGAKPLRQWDQALPPTDDHQAHRVELPVQALPAGDYVLLMRGEGKDAPIGAQLFHVSSIAYAQQGTELYVLHRENGQPLAGAQVGVQSRYYDYDSRKYVTRDGGSFSTDKAGFVKLATKVSTEDRGYQLTFRHGGETLSLDETFYTYRSHEPRTPAKPSVDIHFFLDRAIYRPGQTVEFKGIAVQTDGDKKNLVKSGSPYTVELYDANGQKIDSAKLSTNAFGSFSGRFTLPQMGLTGGFRLDVRGAGGNTYFRVEEYKRPKFFTEIEAPKASYKAGDSITVMGKATAYAGNTISGAQVKYRVVRQPRFLYPWLMWRGWQPNYDEQEIDHGTTTTDASGAYRIPFTLLPDRKVDTALKPVFDFRIYADVTDLNGETRSAETVVSAGYSSLIVSLNLPERIHRDSLKNLSVQTQNMAGERQRVPLQIRYMRLTPPVRLIRPRYWEQPDLHVLSSSAYTQLFPYDEYKNETDPRTWPRDAANVTRFDSTDAANTVPLSARGWQAGHYLIQAVARDAEGNEVVDTRYVEVFDNSNAAGRPQYLQVEGSRPIEPGERTTIGITTAATDVYLIRQTDKAGEKGDSREIHSLSANRRVFDYTATETDRGGYGAAFFFVKHNRLFQHGETIAVPWTNKDLKIEWSSFRDKTLPGAEEKWSVKLSGYKGTQVAAEMLASGYDASLDQFAPHNWSRPGLWPGYYARLNWNGGANFSKVEASSKYAEQQKFKVFEKRYDRLLFVEWGGDFNRRALSGAVRGISVENAMMAPVPPASAQSRSKTQGYYEEGLIDAKIDVVKQAGIKDEGIAAPIDGNGNPEKKGDPKIQPRTNLRETAFFLPHLQTDKDGNISFTFTAPEALTKWKIQALAHTTDLAFGLSNREFQTQKELMVQPAAPRFLRQGDELEFSTKIANLSGKELTGQASLDLIDAATGKSVDGWFVNAFPTQYFTVAAGMSEAVKFPIQVPSSFTGALTWRITARANVAAQTFSDGEEATLPVLTNRQLLTETLPMPMRTAGTKEFRFEKLLAANSPTLQHHALTIEWLSNPAWAAVQALPYLAEKEDESTWGAFRRFYANALAQKISGSSPRIREIFQKWRTEDSAALISNLQKNEELKSVLLQETPWVMAAESESEQRRNIGLLFEAVRMSENLGSALADLKQKQSSNGGFVWFPGSPEDRWTTQSIAEGLGRLKMLGAWPTGMEGELRSIVAKALLYLDARVKEDYDRLVRNKVDLKKQSADYLHIHYLYTRSFFPEMAVAAASGKAHTHYRESAKRHWLGGGRYMQGMTALALHRSGDKVTPAAILRSLKETSLESEEMGMYWKDIQWGRHWAWWSAPIETHSLLTEAFFEIGKDLQTVDALRTWLLKHKQTNRWHTGKATADACYVLLRTGTDWLAATPSVTIALGADSRNLFRTADEKTEAGTGYFKKRIATDVIQPALGNIKVTVESAKPSSASWGAAYWQYFEDMDKVTAAETPLKLSKKLFREEATAAGPVLNPVGEGATLQVGDKVVVRIELRVDREMDYVHMKDLRASAFEPVNVLSGWRWQGGLGYYEATGDVSTNFYFSTLRKGTYVFEYPLFVTHLGKFSGGITTIQSLYAPEFSSHSEGVTVRVE